MIVRTSLISLAIALLAAVPVMAQSSPITCEGVFGPDSSEALVKQTFGADNVVTGMVPGPEGTEILATTVFPDDPDRRMEFGWWDEDKLERLSYVDLAPDQQIHGLQLGMSVAEVEAINGASFTIGGFGWDYGGYADFEGGALDRLAEDGCGLSVRFDLDYDAVGETDIGTISGEVTVPSDEPLLQAGGAHVVTISLGYPWPEDLPEPQY